MKPKPSRKVIFLIAGVAMLFSLGCGLIGPKAEPADVATATSAPCEDIFESPVRDDAPAGAKVLAAGETQTRNFGRKADVDYVKINLESNMIYTISTSNLGASVDTQITLEKERGGMLVNDDDPASAPASRLTFQDVSGTYLVKVINRFGVGGCDTNEFSYDITLTEAQAPEPTVTPAATYTPTPAPAATAAPAGTMSVKWLDKTRQTQVFNSQGSLIETWELADLQRFLRTNKVIAETETLSVKDFTSGYSGLHPSPSTDWLRIGSLATFLGQICRISRDEKVIVSCWRVMPAGAAWVKTK